MKKTLLLLLAAILLPMTIGAQKLAPSRVELADNQLILGHYTTDDIVLGGCWGKPSFRGLNTIATDLTPEELAMFQGSKIVAFRVGMSLPAPVTRVFVIPIDGNGNLGDITEWSCNVSDEGWNVIELDSPYLIDLPADYMLRIGFDYEQLELRDKPISAVNVGTIYPTYHYRLNKWGIYMNNVGNLSLQCIAENDNFPSYVVMLRNLKSQSIAVNGQDLSFSFETCNKGVGNIPANGCTYDIAIDGTVVATVTNPEALSDNYAEVKGTLPISGLTEGEHTLSVTVVSTNGEAVEHPATLSRTFKCFNSGFPRQMRLVEQFTSTYCTWCPLGSQNLTALCDLRGDVAWVGVHQNMSGTDPFKTLQCDSIASYQNCTGYPEGSFDRTPGCNDDDASQVCAVLSYNSPAYGGAYFNSFLESIATEPSWASVNISSTYDAETRKAVITVNGDVVPDFNTKMGADSRLTVYITEDNLVAAQYNQSSWVDDYVHNGVLRLAPGGVRGVALNRTGDSYVNEFEVDIPTDWNADNLNIVAFISRPLRSNALSDLYVTNANKRHLGENDTPDFIPGDLNGDGKVNVSDVTLLIQVALSEDASGINPDAADLNGDGTINVSDVTMLIQLAIMN